MEDSARARSRGFGAKTPPNERTTTDGIGVRARVAVMYAHVVITVAIHTTTAIRVDPHPKRNVTKRPACAPPPHPNAINAD